MVISKSKTAGIYVKHMVSEILLLIASNRSPNLVAQLVVHNMISFMFDLRQSILSETSKAHELAVEAEINVAQTIAKILISTNPVLIHSQHKSDSIRLMAKCLLS